ncbi:MAG: hypothetical protein EG823_06935 [Actinobacteria bacterium]|nr:hypothetical protein [Actinomycetota bacterium]
MRRWGTRALAVGCVLWAALGVSAAAVAQEAVPAAETSATAPYELDFTLPSDARSGCLVCHGDPALVRVREGAVVSFFINEEQLRTSTHADTQCVGCHIDFAYTAPHEAADWPITAKSACRNCHADQSKALGAGVHRQTVDVSAAASAGAVAVPAADASTETSVGPKPLCGDCHGSHGMLALTEKGGEDWKDGKAELHQQGWQVCGRCHEDYWDNYSDYYHGAAYKLGAEDAPACWDCHGWHDIQPSKNRDSKVNEVHLVETCGQEGCHNGVDENYTEYAAFIHGRPDVEAENPILKFFRSIGDAIGRLFGGGDDT